MSELISQLTPFISPIVSSLAAMIIAFVYAAKVHADKLKIQAEKEIAVSELEKENLALQKAIVENSFIICPSCGEKIKLSEATIQRPASKGEL